MSLTRNQQRAMAKERAKAKALRLYNREIALTNERNRAIVAANRNAKAEPSIRSCLANLKGQSHRVYVCRAAGAGPEDTRKKDFAVPVPHDYAPAASYPVLPHVAKVTKYPANYKAKGSK